MTTEIASQEADRRDCVSTGMALVIGCGRSQSLQCVPLDRRLGVMGRGAREPWARHQTMRASTTGVLVSGALLTARWKAQSLGQVEEHEPDVEVPGALR